jgi:hypothetical protein
MTVGFAFCAIVRHLCNSVSSKDPATTASTRTQLGVLVVPLLQLAVTYVRPHNIQERFARGRGDVFWQCYKPITHKTTILKEAIYK